MGAMMQRIDLRPIGCVRGIKHYPRAQHNVGDGQLARRNLAHIPASIVLVAVHDKALCGGQPTETTAYGSSTARR